MIPLSNTEKTESSTPLAQLEQALREGSLARAVEQQRLGDRLRRTRHELEHNQLIDRLSAVVPAAQSVRSEVSERADLERRLRQIQVIAQGLTKAETQDELNEVLELLRNAPGWLETVERQLERGWKAWLEVSFDRHQRLGRLLERFEGTRDAGERLQRVASDGLGLAASFPPSAAQTERAQDLLRQRDAIIEELHGQESTQDLLGFLERVLMETATLEHVTENLFHWLREHHALGLLRIRL